MFKGFRPDPLKAAAILAYRKVVEQARAPGFFIATGVPDTLDGRFELICLHAFLYLHRLKREQPGGGPLGQRFFDAMFADFDRSLREMGTGDLSVGREVKRMAEAFYGRIAAYEHGLMADDETLRAALERNLFGTVIAVPSQVAMMADYVRSAAAALDAQSAAALIAGELFFADPPKTAVLHQPVQLR